MTRRLHPDDDVIREIMSLLRRLMTSTSLRATTLNEGTLTVEGTGVVIVPDIARLSVGGVEVMTATGWKKLDVLIAEVADALEAAETALNNRVDGVESTNTTQNTRLDSHAERLGAAENVNTTQNTRLNNVESTNTTQNTRLDSVESDISALQNAGYGGQISTLENKVSQLETSIANLAQRITNLENAAGS